VGIFPMHQRGTPMKKWALSPCPSSTIIKNY